MKTKLSKKLLSLFLAVMMIVTSVPIISLSASGATEDAAVTEVRTAMKELETKLATKGTFTNVTPAYEAYVDCQEAIDAYIYGGEADALNGVADKLRTAISKIGDFTGVEVNEYVPTFPNSTNSDMVEYHEKGYNNILFSPTATVQFDEACVTGINTGGVKSKLYHSPNTIVLYDGVNEIQIPVMVSTYRSGSASFKYDAGKVKYVGKPRYIISAYPGNDKGDNTDGWFLSDLWNSGNGQDANWNWNWYSGTQKAKDDGKYVDSHAFYNYADGKPAGSATFTTHSGNLPDNNRKGDSNELFMSNILRYNGTPTAYEGTYQIEWIVTNGGGDSNNDYVVSTAANPIRILNYKTLVDALAKNGEKMKTVQLGNYSEGGLLAYFQAMDAATLYNPNDYYNSSTNTYDMDGTSGAVTVMKTLVRNMNNASTKNTNSDDYAALRTAFADNVMTTYNNGQLTYTDASWAVFKVAYENAQSIMADVNDNGYVSTAAATAATALTDAYNALEENIVRVDTSALEALIDEVLSYDVAAFTSETYAPVLTAINNAKKAIWGSVDDYKVTTSAPEDSEIARQAVQERIEAINAVLPALRLSMDYLVPTTEGLFSLNSASALKDTIEDPTAYTNYQDFIAAVNAGSDYALEAASTEFTNYTTQIKNYTTKVKAIITAYANLKTSFIKLPNGYVAKEIEQIDMKSMSSLDRKTQQIDFAYTPIAIIMRTKHEGVTIDYGNVDVRFTTDCEVTNNMLDSININATMPALGANGDYNHITSAGPLAHKRPKVLSDQQKIDYAGNLQLGEFSVENLRFDKKDINSAGNTLLTLQDGTAINDIYQARQVDLDPILTSTEGVSADPAHGGVFSQSTDGNVATTYIHGNQQIVLPDTTAASTLPAELPEVEHYIQEGYFGAVTSWAVESSPGLWFAGYNWLTSQQNDGEKIQMQAYVVDMSYLVDLVAECDAILDDSNMYTTTSWNNFTKALKNAKDYDIDGVAANDGDVSAMIYGHLNSRYKALKTAYEALTLKTMNVTFSYKNADGTNTTTVLHAPYGSKISTIRDQIDAITPPTYVADYKTWTFTGWSPAINDSAEIRYDMTFTAQYSGVLNKANWDSFNAAKAALLNALEDNKYSVESLNAAQALVAQVTYFGLDSAGQAAIMADNQANIDAETAKLTSALSALVTVTYDTTVAEAVKKELTDAKKNDPDMYNNNLDFTYQETVTVAGVPVIGLIYDTQETLNAAIRVIVAAMQPQTYTIKLNGEIVGTAQYGKNVLVASDGRFKVVDDLASEEFNDSALVGWKYSYSAPSTNGDYSADKYMFTSPSCGFIVNGDTNLTTVAAKAGEGSYVVKIVSGINNRVISIINTTGTFEMPSAPAYPFYSFSGYSNGLAAGAECTVTADTTIVANYTAEESNSFTISYIASYYDLFDGVYENITVGYNDLVELSNPDAYCWAIVNIDVNDEYNNGYLCEYQIVKYGTDYSFYAYQNLEFIDYSVTDGSKALVALSKDVYDDIVKMATDDSGNFDDYSAYDVILDSQGNKVLADIVDGEKVVPDAFVALTQLETPMPVYADGAVAKFNLIGTFALPDDCSIVETGFIFATDPSATNLTIENCNNAGIYRYKTSKQTIGNQFAIAIKDPGRAVEFKYAAYAIVKDAEGNVATYYANPITANNAF